MRLRNYVAHRADYANISSPDHLHRTIRMDTKTLLTIAETAELLNCSSGFVRKRISLSESNQEGGWPKNVYINLQPNGAKSLYRVNKTALETYLQTSVEEIIEDEIDSAPCSVCVI